jgi:hypothetical protein
LATEHVLATESELRARSIAIADPLQACLAEDFNDISINDSAGNKICFCLPIAKPSSDCPEGAPAKSCLAAHSADHSSRSGSSAASR